MGVLEDKLLDLYAKDAAVKATLDASGAIVKTKDAPDKVDVAKVDGKLLAKAKAQVHAALAVPAPFTHEGHVITITALSLDGDVLRVDLAADCPTDGPYFFVNPPLQVVTKEAVVETKDGLPVVKTPCETVDAPDDDLRAIVGQAVHTVAVMMGWKP